MSRHDLDWFYCPDCGKTLDDSCEVEPELFACTECNWEGSKPVWDHEGGKPF